ncbi:hypothetical protein LMG28727_00827 [Paraburkholderia kirstenboschensis]|uniref:hypothetical protein n=1 Tax=Paraburkholderia kirstenboschensis TaxID=1245436 RepID=UPI00191A5FB4|nr:hypothetical protein [Paraburkholderia kirstenboschensis]CAD6514058.1 hypothetical protein LMG28727_00827 [Paraburkholderia kirstenboschensis]
MSDTNKNEQPVSLTEVLNTNSIPLSAVAANKVLHSSGMTEVRWRASSKPGRAPKSYRAATSLGEQHGAVNEVNTVGSGDPILLKYLPSMFPALWAHKAVQDTLAAMLREGEVKYRDGGAQDAGEVF